MTQPMDEVNFELLPPAHEEQTEQADITQQDDISQPPLEDADHAWDPELRSRFKEIGKECEKLDESTCIPLIHDASDKQLLELLQDEFYHIHQKYSNYVSVLDKRMKRNRACAKSTSEITTKDSSGETWVRAFYNMHVLGWAIYHNHSDIIKLIFDKCVESNDIRLHKIVFPYLGALDDTELRNEVITKIRDKGTIDDVVGPDPGMKNILHRVQKMDESLFDQVGVSNIKLMELVSAPDSDENTPLHYSLENADASLITSIDNLLNVSEFMEILKKPCNKKKQNSFHIACESGFKDIVKLIAKSIGSEKIFELLLNQDIYGCTALHYVSAKGHEGVMKYIVKEIHEKQFREILTIENSKLETALHQACVTGQEGIVRIIADHVSENEFGNILHKTCLHGNTKIANIIFKKLKTEELKKVLVQQDLETNSTVLHSILEKGNTELVKLFEDKLDVNILDECAEIRDQNDNTVFLYACRYGSVHIVRMILNTYTQLVSMISQKNNENKNCLHLASDNKDVIKVILDSLVLLMDDLPKRNSYMKKLLCHKDCNGNTAFSYALLREDKDVTSLMLEMARESLCLVKLLGSTDNDGKTIFHKVCQVGSKSSSLLPSVVETIAHAMEDNSQLHCHFVNILKETDRPEKKTFIFYFSKSSDEGVMKNLIQLVTLLECKHAGSCLQDLLVHQDAKGRTAMEYSNLEYPSAWSDFLSPFMDRSRDSQPDTMLHYSNKAYVYNKEHSLLAAMSKSQCLDLIKHDYTQDYLKNRQWNIVSCLLWINLLLYIGLLGTLTCSVLQHKNHGGNQIRSNNSLLNTSVYSEYCKTSEMHSTDNTASFIVSVLLMIFACLNLTCEVIQMIIKRLHYWKALSNYFDLTVCLLSVVYAAVSLTRVSGYLWCAMQQGGILAMCIAWPNLTSIITKFPYTGECGKGSYFLRISTVLNMLFRVTLNVFAFLPVYAVFVISFTLGFYMLFGSDDEFTNFGFAIMKTMAMTSGELDFNALYIEDPAAVNEYFPFSCVIFVLFVFIMSISMMNLLVAQAVGDFNELNAMGDILQFRRNIDRLLEVEAILQFIHSFQAGDSDNDYYSNISVKSLSVQSRKSRHSKLSIESGVPRFRD